MFADDTPDMNWIAELGRRGLVVLTRDEEISRRPNEIVAGRRNGGAVRGRLAGLAMRCHATSRTRHPLNYPGRAGGVTGGLRSVSQRRSARVATLRVLRSHIDRTSSFGHCAPFDRCNARPSD